MQAPPVLTAERIDAMLSIMAEVCLELVVEGGQRQKAAEDVEAFERAGRALHSACRNLRQAIALKQRFDREEARKADDARRATDLAQAEAERQLRMRTGRNVQRVRDHFERILWDEYEESDAQEFYEDLDARVMDMSEDEGFLDIPFSALVERLADEIGLTQALSEKRAAEAREAADAAVPRAAPRAQTRLAPPPKARPPKAEPPKPEPPKTEPPKPEPPEAAVAPSSAIDPPEDPPPPAPSPAEAARAPPPEPYLPPWEKLRPGQIMPGGGTGW